jgi:hypothetical protein
MLILLNILISNFIHKKLHQSGFDTATFWPA